VNSSLADAVHRHYPSISNILYHLLGIHTKKNCFYPFGTEIPSPLTAFRVSFQTLGREIWQKFSQLYKGRCVLPKFLSVTPWSTVRVQTKLTDY
jgi:hypothetical protein